jgi:hypothetical protein
LIFAFCNSISNDCALIIWLKIADRNNKEIIFFMRAIYIISIVYCAIFIKFGNCVIESPLQIDILGELGAMPVVVVEDDEIDAFGE